MNDKKARERYIVTEFAKVYSDFPHGDLSDSEEPDFRVADLGIEITRFMHGPIGKKGSKIHETEQLRSRVIATAQRKFEAIYSTPYWVSIVWVGGHIQFKDVEPLSTELANLIETCTNKGTLEYNTMDLSQLPYTPLSQVIEQVWTTRWAGQSCWSDADSGWVYTTYEPLKKLVAEKEPKLPMYRQKCGSVWLLIAADGNGVSSVAELSPYVQPETVETAFDRVFFFSLQSKRIVVLAKNR